MLLLTSCGGNAPKLSEQETAAFCNAPPELKQTWEKALGAVEANDFSAASSAFFRLMGQNLTPEQGGAVHSAIASLNHRMYAAAEKGDAAALKALQDMKSLSHRR